MKPIYAKLANDKQNPIFGTKQIDLPKFSNTFHFHEECQLIAVLAGEGTRIIGDHIEHFKSGEVIFVGANIPHVWNNDPYGFEGQPPSKARSIALFFAADTLLKLLENCGEMMGVKRFLAQSWRGMKFYGASATKLRKLLLDICTENDDLLRLRLFLSIVNELRDTKEYQLLCSAGFINSYNTRHDNRLNKVMKLVFEKFDTEIRLAEVADLAGMNKQAFCRFFKQHTQKTFVQFLNEVRVGNATKLLSNANLPISEIASRCGFDTLSNFNKFFRQIKGESPRDYRKKLML